MAIKRSVIRLTRLRAEEQLIQARLRRNRVRHGRISHLALGQQFPALGTMQTLAKAFTVKTLFPVPQRIRAAFARTGKDESARAVEEDTPDSVRLEGTLNPRLWLAARIACRIIFPAEDPECMEGRERIDRIQRALSHALVTVMAEEREGVVGRVARLRSEQREGHA